MPEKYSRGERNLGAAEATAGAGVGIAAASGKVPDIVNSWARSGRKAKYEYAHSRIKGNDPQTTEKPDFTKGRGYDKAGKKWVDLKSLDEDSTKLVDNVNTKTGQTFKNKVKVTPRRDAYNAAWEHHNRLKRAAEDKVHLPFPESKWQYNKKGKKKKRVAAVDPKTGGKIRDKAGKIKLIEQPAKVGQVRRSMLKVAAVPVAGGLIWHGARTMAHQGDLHRAQVGKALTRGETDAAVAGGAIGGTLYHAPSFTEWGGRSKEDKSTLKDKKSKAILDEWKTKYDLHGQQRGVGKWTEAYRNYPHQLPGSEMRRVMAHTHAGPTGAVLTGAAIGAGALTGVGAVRTRKKISLRRKK